MHRLASWRPWRSWRSVEPRAGGAGLGQGEIVWALIGDLLVWSGVVRRELSLEALERTRVRRRRARAARGGGA